MENVLKVVYILLVFATVVAVIALATFPPIRQARQPARSLLLGLEQCSSGSASISLALFGAPSVWPWLVSTGVITTGIGGGLIGF